MSYQQYPGPGQPQQGSPQSGSPQPGSPWSSTPVIVAIIAGVVLLIGGVVAALVYTNNTSTSTATATESSAPTGPVTITHTATPTAPGNPGTPGTTDQPTPTAPTTTEPGAQPITVPGADRQGFLSGPRCNAADDDAVFIGATSRSRVVICQVGSQTGRYYYKGLADGDAIEIGYPTRSGDTFVATNGSVQYVVTPGALTISENGEVLSTEPMQASWVG